MRACPHGQLGNPPASSPSASLGQDSASPTHGFHPRSAGLMYRMPALETVAGVAVLRWLISNTSLMVRFRGIRSLLARVRTWEGGQACGRAVGDVPSPRRFATWRRPRTRGPMHPCPLPASLRTPDACPAPHCTGAPRGAPCVRRHCDITMAFGNHDPAPSLGILELPVPPEWESSSSAASRAF